MKLSSPSFAAVPSSSLGGRAARGPGAAAPAPQGGGRGFCPHTACGGGRRRAAPGSFPNRAPAARRPTLDQETLLILVVLAFLLRCRADRELIWALLYILLF